jgi:hypothetical protein
MSQRSVPQPRNWRENKQKALDRMAAQHQVRREQADSQAVILSSINQRLAAIEAALGIQHAEDSVETNPGGGDEAGIVVDPERPVPGELPEPAPKP